MSNYLSLDEAAKILGISTDELIEMRSRGEIFGYRDGPSWKFKQEEIERVQGELGGDALDEDAGGSSILVSEREVGASGSKSGPTIGKDSSDLALGSDLKLSDDKEGSDVALVPDPNSGSGVKLVQKSPSDSSSDLDLGSDLDLSVDPAEASGIDLVGRQPDSNVLGSDLRLQSGSKGGTPVVSGSGSLDLGGDLELASDDEDDLVLGSDSGIGLGSESGINLMSPSDSGLSLEDEPLDLAGTGISGLDLGSDAGSDVGGSKPNASGISGLGSGVLVDFDQGEEFQLTPSGGIEADDDSGSQVIELEDSGSFGDGVGMPEAAGMVVEEGADFGGSDLVDATAAGGMVALRGAPETPYTGLQVGMLAMVLLLMGLCGILTSDILRNLWGWDGETDYSTGLTSALVKAIGSK
ncbi:MAG: helix-turn-helix domain-containing protein [Planctomycetes bacterium]|nr:helix-turn-helix domain-containing protein [Planctomycetota bacterium]